MISDYLISYNTLDDIQSLKDKHSEKGADQFWFLKNHSYESFVWHDSIFSPFEIDKIIQIGKSLECERGNGFDQNFHSYRKSFVSWIHTNNANAWIYRRLSEHINDINQKFFQFDLEKIETLQFTYYDSKENGFYERHVDPLKWNIPHNRKLTVVIQLSDPSNYEGGELILYDTKDGTKMERKKGLSTFFPSHILHECTPVTKGERYSLVAWIHGPAFK